MRPLESQRGFARDRERTGAPMTVRSDERPEGGVVKLWQYRGTEPFAAAQASLDWFGASKVDNRDWLRSAIHQPAFADAVLTVPSQLLCAVVRGRSGRQH